MPVFQECLDILKKGLLFHPRDSSNIRPELRIARINTETHSSFEAHAQVNGDSSGAQGMLSEVQFEVTAHPHHQLRKLQAGIHRGEPVRNAAMHLRPINLDVKAANPTTSEVDVLPLPRHTWRLTNHGHVSPYPILRGQVMRSVPAPSFLVSYEGQQQITFQRSCLFEGCRGKYKSGHRRLHVRGPEAIQPAVLDGGFERVGFPFVPHISDWLSVCVGHVQKRWPVSGSLQTK